MGLSHKNILSCGSSDTKSNNMTHSYRLHFFHLIWSTKQRLAFITPELQIHLYPYLGGIVANHHGNLIAIGGMPDHVHLLIELSNLDKFSGFIRDLKASSSLWIHKNYSSSHVILHGKKDMAHFQLVFHQLNKFENIFKTKKCIMRQCHLRKSTKNS